ncbi:carboxymuconolactone decarboxylase family protein [Actinoplanes palleronii]|uniref:Carboxymuconolactone decarboxylase n=1 Tax=Actinoplanes palleronii TaxID=113570 RepID=A0ABQ4BJS7_9ACTN|nr:carboxymuconolactone decarboxylase family protein [Actinoplanes palleronii]GIE70556.1 carboxymuconolactone decarboxylase [Actinoplanes palleronii]
MPKPRITPLPTEDWTDEVDDAFAVLRGHAPAEQSSPPARPKANILGIYARHPAFVRGWMPFSQHLRHSTLSDRVREMVILRTTWLGFGEYEWAQHVWMSRAAGYLTDAEIAALSEGPDAAQWSPGDAAVVRAVDEMCTVKNVSDVTWSELANQFSPEQLIDLTFTVGTYDMHCTAFTVLGLQLDEGLIGFPEHHRRDA